MKRTMLILASCLMVSTAFASDWMIANQDIEDGVWTDWLHSSATDHMEAVIGDCNAAMLIKPHAVKIRFSDGSEKLFLCGEIRAKHPL